MSAGTQFPNKWEKSGGHIIPTHRAIMARRKAFFKRHLLGQDHPDIIAALQPKYGGAAKTYYNDWTKRAAWLPDIIKAGDAETWMAELLAKLHYAQSRLWRMGADKEVQDSVRLGAYKLLQEGISRELELLQSLGKLPKVAEKLEQKNGLMEERRILLDVTEDEDAILCRAARILDEHIQRTEKLH